MLHLLLCYGNKNVTLTGMYIFSFFRHTDFVLKDVNFGMTLLTFAFHSTIYVCFKPRYGCGSTLDVAQNDPKLLLQTGFPPDTAQNDPALLLWTLYPCDLSSDDTNVVCCLEGRWESDISIRHRWEGGDTLTITLTLRRTVYPLPTGVQLWWTKKYSALSLWQTQWDRSPVNWICYQIR